MVAFLSWTMLAFFPLYQQRKDVSTCILLQFLPAAGLRALGIFLGALVDALRILGGAPYIPFGRIDVTEVPEQ